ncbi:large proline-rich protein bag6-A isoform X2 [Daktulosphaira vitifoliae]|uniref:large proline-rich protein bag6-A isoform X2 n=1 Tax=Daktulosphaira vitifoliae TaxID=58002 RepID=UPI0021AAC176|nr:large proline-rich protein bag6-A isoform X2 [Daktulosphaira vitifoliae]
MIDLTIKTLDSRNHKFTVPDNYTILELKEHIAEEVNVEVVQQRLIFCGRVLSNETKLADIGIDGKVMHLVQKVPRLASSTSGTSTSSTTTNTNSRSGQNGGSRFAGWHTPDPTVVFGAIGIPSDFMHVREIPRPMSNRNHGTSNRMSMAMDMIRKCNEILDRLENPLASQNEQIPMEDIEQPDQFSEENTQEETLGETMQVPPPATSQPDQDSVNVSYEVDDSYPNTVVVTIDATHHVRMPSGLMHHMQNQLHSDAAQSGSQDSSEQNNETASNPLNIQTPSVSQTQSQQTTSNSTSATDRNSRDDHQNSDNRSPSNIMERRRFKKLIDELNKLNVRLQPFYILYCQFITDDPEFESADGENGSDRAQNVFNSVSEVMHYKSHIYHAISDLKISFNRPPPRPFQSRTCLLQRGILHTAHTIPMATVPPPTQQPSSTQTTNANQSIPSVRAFRLDFMNPDGVAAEPVNVSTSVSNNEINNESNTNTTTESNTESNNTLSDYPTGTPHSVELMFDLTPGSIRIDSVEAAFVAPNVASNNHPTATSQTTTSGELTNNMGMSIDWMDQMIDVISSGVRRPFMSDQTLDWSSIPTTSTRTPRVTPRTTDSSSTSNSPSQGIFQGRDNSPRMDPYLPCSSHHFESHLRSMVLARRPTRASDRSTVSNNSTTNTTSAPTSPSEMRPFTGRLSRSRNRYIQDPDGYLSGIHPILTWGRNRNNVVTITSANNTAQTTSQDSGTTTANTLAGHIREGMEMLLEREAFIDRSRDLNGQGANISGQSAAINNGAAVIGSLLQGLESINTNVSQIGRDEYLSRRIGSIPFFSGLEGRSVLMDILLTIAQDWTLHDVLYLNTTSETSSIIQHPVSRYTETLTNFILDRIMFNQTPSNQNIEDAANRIYQELLPYINVIQCSATMRSNVDFGATILRYITLNLRGIVICCIENRAGASNDIVTSLSLFCQGLLSLLAYCCNNRSVFRLNIGALLRSLPLPTNLQNLIMNNVRINIDRYWDAINDYQISIASVCNYIVPASASSSQPNEEQSSNSNSVDISNDPLPEVVIGSQEWHHSVPPEWVPVIARDTQRQRRQGAQPPYSDAYLSGMPNKRRKIVNSSKPQGSLSQIISKNLEVAMGAAGVAINKEVTASVGADSAVQNAYTERIRTYGRSGLDTHPDFSPDRYPNASKFFYNHNHQN